MFGLYLTEIEISLLFFSLLFEEKWVWVYIYIYIYISRVVCLRWWWFDRERRWIDLVWGKVDQFWVSGTDLGVSEGHVRIKGRETQVAWVNNRHGGFLLIF